MNLNLKEFGNKGYLRQKSVWWKTKGKGKQKLLDFEFKKKFEFQIVLSKFKGKKG